MKIKVEALLKQMKNKINKHKCLLFHSSFLASRHQKKGKKKVTFMKIAFLEKIYQNSNNLLIKKIH